MSDAVFDWASRFSEHIHRADAIRLKKRDLAQARANVCGNCEHWMKTTCKPEKQHKQFKSCSSSACGDFKQTQSSQRREVTLARELDEMTHTAIDSKGGEDGSI